MGLDVATLTCPDGSLINGKKDAVKKKLICKCGKSGKCKWKNEKNKKINKMIYQKWKCVGGETSPGDGGDTSGGGGNGGDNNDPTDVCPQENYH